MDLLREGARRLGLYLTAKQEEQFARYCRELLAWNLKMNLTTIVEYEEVQVKHFLDSLTPTLAVHDRLSQGGSLLDIGAGGGFPGIPLKIAYPNISLTLMDSVGKKGAFLQHIISDLELDDTSIHVGRAEEGAMEPHLRETFDVVVSRGVASMRVLMELTLPYCTQGGATAVLKKGDIEPEVSSSLHAMDVLGGQLRRVVPVVGISGLEDDRVVVVVDKVSATPAKYPRRPGLPQKHPL